VGIFSLKEENLTLKRESSALKGESSTLKGQSSTFKGQSSTIHLESCFQQVYCQSLTYKIIILTAGSNISLDGYKSLIRIQIN